MASESPWATPEVETHYNLSDQLVTVRSDDWFISKLQLSIQHTFKYHPGSTQIIFSSKGNKKSYRQSCMNKTAAICLRPPHNIHKLGDSSYQETLHVRIDNFRMNTGMVDTVPLIIWLHKWQTSVCLSRTFVVAKESNRGKATSYEYTGWIHRTH
jgi:hypothetical protein